MLGYDVRVCTADSPFVPAASWQASVGFLSNIEILFITEKIKVVSHRGGYPNIYEMDAKTFNDVMTNDKFLCIKPGTEFYNHAATIDASKRYRMEVWDQS